MVSDILLPYSPVKNQASTASCWAFSLCSYWETENAIRCGLQTPDLEYSPFYLARHKIIRMCERKMRESILPIKRLPVGAMGQTAVDISHQCGMATFQSYQVSEKGQYANYRKMMRLIQLFVWLGQATFIFRKPMLALIRKTIDHFWLEQPEAASLIRKAMPEISFYTSFNHMPFNQDVVLPLPDNFEGWSFFNVPIDELILKMKDTLSHGHSFVWQGCIRRGFSSNKGLALLPESVIVNDNVRSEAFLSGKITDDHMMHIIGLAHDDTGRIFFVAKNSVGEVGPFHGLIYIEENFIKLNTIAVGL